MNTVSRVMVGCVVTALMLVVPLRGNAQEPEPTPKPAATKAPAKRMKTLSDLAGGIKLQQSPEDKAGGVVIDNSNLKAMGQGAVVSEGKNLGGSASALPSGNQGVDDTPGESPEMDALHRKIQGLEQKLDALDDASKERDKVNMYTGAGPQYRPPGVSDPVDTQRKKIEADLQAAKERAQALERKAKRDRARFPPQPAPSDSGG